MLTLAESNVTVQTLFYNPIINEIIALKFNIFLENFIALTRKTGQESH